MDFLPIHTIGGLLGVVLGFGFIIFVHEMGHFLVAKWVGIKCSQFAVGMGNAICSWRKGLGFRWGSTEPEVETRVREHLKSEESAKISTEQRDRAMTALGLSETEYRLNWIPLGGYVKMVGQEDMDASAVSTDPRAFNNKPIWARACVISAGVVMNLIFGVLFFMIAFLAGVGFHAPVAGDIGSGMPAEETYAKGHEGDPAYRGLRYGDLFLTVNGEPVRDLADVIINAALSEKGKPMPLEVSRTRDGKTEKLTYEMVPRVGGQGLLTIAIDKPRGIKISEKYPPKKMPEDLEKAGVKPGMQIVEANGKPVEDVRSLVDALALAGGKDVPVKFQNKETGASVTVQGRGIPRPFSHRDSADGVIFPVMGLVPATMIEEVAPKSPAEKAGLLAGDIIRRIDEVEWPSGGDVSTTVRESKRDTVRVVVVRNGEEKDFDIAPNSDRRLGIGLGNKTNVIRKVLGDNAGTSPLAGLQLPPGTTIAKVAGEPVKAIDDLFGKLVNLAIAKPEGFDIAVSYQLAVGKNPIVTDVNVKVGPVVAKELRAVEWMSSIPIDIFEMQLTTLQASNPIDAVSLGIGKAHQSMLQVYLTLYRLTQGTVPLSGMQGPVGITHTGTIIAQQGFTYLLFFLGLISINLAVINFLPLPIVDGGHIILLIIEKLKGSPVSPKIQQAVLYAGLAMLGSLFLYVTFNDIVRLIDSLFKA